MPSIPMRRASLGPVVNEGARQAWLAMSSRGLDQAQLRAVILQITGEKITSGQLVKYLYCDRRPGVEWSQIFQRVLGVDPGAWYRGPDVTFEPPAAKGAA